MSEVIQKWKKIDGDLVLYTLAFLFLIIFTIYSVFWTPYGWWKSYIENRENINFSNQVLDYYSQNNIVFQDEYTQDIFKWFDIYNEAYRNRNCDFMKYVSVSLSQWEKNYINNIPVEKKFQEEYVKWNDYDCPSYDNINIKSIWSPISGNIEVIELWEWKPNIIKATWFFSHSKTENGSFIWLSKREYTIWKLDNWETWRIHKIDTIH